MSALQPPVASLVTVRLQESEEEEEEEEEEQVHEDPVEDGDDSVKDAGHARHDCTEPAEARGKEDVGNCSDLIDRVPLGRVGPERKDSLEQEASQLPTREGGGDLKLVVFELRGHGRIQPEGKESHPVAPSRHPLPTFAEPTWDARSLRWWRCTCR